MSHREGRTAGATDRRQDAGREERELCAQDSGEPIGSAEPLRDGDAALREGREITRMTANGVAIHAFVNPALHGFFLALYLRAGCLYESEAHAGITHFFEHTAIRNVEKITGGRLYRDLDRAGLDMNATTYSEMVQFYVSGASCHFERGARFLSMLLSPFSLDRAGIDAERKRIKAEIRESDDRSSLATFSNGIVYRGTPLAYSILGTCRTVNAINGACLEAFRRQITTRENLFFYLTGNVSERDIDALAAMIGSYDIPHGVPRLNIAPVPCDFFAREPEVAVKDADYTALRFSFDLDMTKVSVAETDLLYDVLLAGNNSRFYLEMSELRGMFYDIAGSIERYANIGSFYFTFEVKEKEIYEAADMVTDILNDFCAHPIDAADMMKAGYVDNAYLLYDDPREFNFAYAYDNHIGNAGYRTVGDRVAAYRAVTPERLCEVARCVFRPENLVLTVKGNRRRIRVDRLREIVCRVGRI